MWEELEIILVISSILSIPIGLYLLLKDASKDEENPD
mgnify:CR=1 FL=1|tara:strand:+ start:383 stop:493 length:111 start_codon:yes stop_codon:yes gene_type:complete